MAAYRGDKLDRPRHRPLAPHKPTMSPLVNRTVRQLLHRNDHTAPFCRLLLASQASTPTGIPSPVPIKNSHQAACPGGRPYTLMIRCFQSLIFLSLPPATMLLSYRKFGMAMQHARIQHVWFTRVYVQSTCYSDAQMQRRGCSCDRSARLPCLHTSSRHHQPCLSG